MWIDILTVEVKIEYLHPLSCSFWAVKGRRDFFGAQNPLIKIEKNNNKQKQSAK